MSDKNAFAVNPPMGWNSWDCYGAAVNEEILLKNADYMAQNLKEYGWKYIVCDIQWYNATAHSSHYQDFSDLCMDEYGRLVPATNRFPSSNNENGFRYIAEYIHKRGLKFGIHIMRGIPRSAVHDNLPVKGTEYRARAIAHASSICCWNTDMYGLDSTRPGAQEYYDSIIDLYASWGVDFIKVDDICVKYAVMNDERTLSYGGDEIEMLRRSIDKCGRKIVLSLSPGPALIENVDHLRKNANMWRITNDFWDEWNAIMEMFEKCRQWAPYVSEGCFPDCDMLPVGHISIVGCEHGMHDRLTRLSHHEQRTMISLWSIFRSPMMLGCELTDMDDWTKSLVTNKNVNSLLARSRNAHQVLRSNKHIIWEADDSEEDGIIYVGVFNIVGWAEEFALKTADLKIEGEWSAYDMWSKTNIGTLEGSMSLKLDAHDVCLLKLTGIDKHMVSK